MFKALFRLLFLGSLVLLVLLAFSYPYVERGSGSFVVMVLAFGFILLTLAGSSVLIYLDWDPLESD